MDDAGHEGASVSRSKLARMDWREFRYLVMSDLYRVTGRVNGLAVLSQALFGGAYRYIFWMRLCRFAGENRSLKFTVYPVARLMLHHLTYKFGISIFPETQIGSGFYIGHFGGVFVSGEAVIGKNCNLSQGVTLGQANRGKNKGSPRLGDNVYVGPGAKIVGSVTVGSNVAIGANCVVTSDIPDDSVVVGIPGRVVSKQGSAGYVNRTDYESKIRFP